MSKNSKRLRKKNWTTKMNHGGARKPAEAAKRMLKSARGRLTAKERGHL